MENMAFWDLMHRSAVECGNFRDRADWLTAQLSEMPSGEIVNFHVRMDQVRRSADTWLMWHAADLILGGRCSGDSFFYFQAWLIGLGRDVMNMAASDPDALVDVPEIRRLIGRPMRDWGDDEWPEWEALDYVATRALARSTAMADDAELDSDADGAEDAFDAAMAARGYQPAVNPEPAGESWDFTDPTESITRLPRLCALFPRR